MLKDQADEPMPVDETHMRYKCPFCMNLEGSKKLVRKHVNETEDGKHRKKNGHTMDETIEAVELKRKYTDLDWKIAQALERFDDIGKDEIKEIAERAEVDWGRVAWVAEKEGVDVEDWGGHKPTTSPDDLSGTPSLMLRAAALFGVEKEDGRLYPEGNTSISEVKRKIDSGGSWRYALDRYGWMVEKDMVEPLDEDELHMTEDQEEGTEEKYEGTEQTTEDMKQKEKDSEEEEDTEESSNKDERTMSAVLEHAGVEVETRVVVKEPKIDAIEKLIEDDRKDMAEKVLEGEVDFE